MKYSLLLLSLLPMAMSAETVLLNETFNDADYNKTVAYTIDGDGKLPHPSIQALFLSSATGTYQPWWIVRDSNASTDMGFASHSFYDEPGQSDDWMITVPITITSEGFVLEFDAQSLTLTEASDKLSDLQLFVTEDLVDPDNLPTVPDKTWERIPRGSKFDEIEGDYTHYSLSMDPWMGKTVRLNFVNRNNDKEILVLDNIKVSRSDLAELSIDAVDRYITEGKYDIKAHVDVVSPEGLSNYVLKINDEDVEAGAFLSQGMHDFTFARDIQPDETQEFTVTLQGDGLAPLQRNGVTSRLLFRPDRAVLVEETTGAWCGNCPMGIYNVEQMLADEEMGKYVIPVSVHIPGSMPDKMVNDEYAEELGINVAPSFTLNRKSPYITLSSAHDALFNPDDNQSLAGRVKAASLETTPISISVDAEPVVQNGDTIAVNITAVAMPALSAGNGRFRVGFILTENNVCCPGSPYWVQENYFSNQPYESKLGGWTELPASVENVRFHDVPRVIRDFNGIVGSLPASITAGESYPIIEILDIPKLEKWDNYGYQERRDIRPYNCEIVAFVIDSETEQVANAAICALDPQAHNRFTTRNLVEESGIEIIPFAKDGIEKYYDLQGRLIDRNNLTHGIYILVKDGSATKVQL